MSNLSDEQIKKALKDAQLLDQTAAQKPPAVEHLLKGCDIHVGDKVNPSGAATKMLVFEHRGSAQQWIVEMTPAGAQAVAKELSKPPVVPNGVVAP